MSELKGAGVNIIPTQCPRFFAACVTAGVELEAGTPGVSNVYSKGVTYDPDEPGTISYHLDNKTVGPLSLAKVWRDPSQDMTEAAALPARMISARTEDHWQSIADDLELLHVYCAIAHIKSFADGKFAIGMRAVTDEEERCAKMLSDMPDTIRNATGRRNGGRIAERFDAIWMPAMFAWVKAWVANYLELKDLWKAANPAIKIEREGFPLVIPKGPQFEKLARRWVK